MPKKSFMLSLILLLSVSTLVHAGGLTIITHGLNGETTGWVDWMGNSIVKKFNDANASVAVYTLKIYADGTNEITGDSLFQESLLTSLQANSGQTIIKLDWSELANKWDSVVDIFNTEMTAAYIVDRLINGYDNAHHFLSLPIHLIGFSRGGSLVCAMANQFGQRGISVDHMTTIDPRPLGWDATLRVYQNVLFADNYWQDIHLIHGWEINGAYNRKLLNLLGGYDDDTDGILLLDASWHFDAHLWYHGAIEEDTPFWDGMVYLTEDERDENINGWWESAENQGLTAGFYYSRIGGGNRLSSYSPNAESNRVIDGYHYMFGGDGSRFNLDWSNADWPNIIKCELFKDGTQLIGESETIIIGETINIEYVGQDYDSENGVLLYLDTDRNPYNNNNLSTSSISNRIHNATSQGYYTDTINIDTSSFHEATGYIYAQITDGSHTRYMYANTKLHFVNPATNPPSKAINPSPNNGATGESIGPYKQMSWSNGGGATSYDIYFGTDPSPDSGEYKGYTIDNIYGNGYVNPNTLAPNTTYYWRIDAVNSDGTTTGDVWSFTTGSAPAKAINPSPISGATGQPIDLGMRMSWSNGGGATSYDIYFGTDPSPDSGEFIYNVTGSTVYYNPNTLAPNTTYYWRIDAVNTFGTTTGDVWSFTTVSAPGLPAKAINPSPNNGTPGQSINTIVSWSNGGGATSYNVYFGTTPSLDSGDSRGNQAATSYDPGALEYSRTYYWRIDAVNTYGTTTGDVWSFGTGPAKAINPSPISGATGQAINTIVSWSNGGWATSYDVYFGTNSSFDSGDSMGNQTGTSYDPGTLAYNTTYYWRIDARDPNGLTTGDVWSFTTAPGEIPELSVIPSLLTVDSGSQSATFTVNNVGTGTMLWSASVQTGGAWLSITSGSSGTNAGTITVSVLENTNNFQRVGTLYISPQNIAVAPQTVSITQLEAGSTDTDGDGESNNIDTDDDNDGISDDIENAAPNNGDGNNDGIADRLQNNVTSIQSYGGGEYITLASPAGTSLSNCQAAGNPATDSAPDDIEFPYGLIDFTINGISPGGSTILMLYFPANATLETYYKYGRTSGDPTDHWYEFLYDGTTGAEIDNTNKAITLHFTDAERGDDILSVDSMVVDLGGPGVASNTISSGSNPNAGGGGGGGGGCFISTSRN